MEKPLDLRIQKTYLALHNAFTELLEEKHFENLTVNDLCERAMIRRTTFYKHFSDKYDYFSFFLKEILETFQIQLPSDITPTDLNSYFALMSRKMLQLITNNYKLVCHLVESNLFPILLDILQSQITNDLIQASKNLPISTEYDPLQIEVISSFYAGGLINMLLHWFKQNTTIDEEQFMFLISKLTSSEFF